MPGLFWIRVIFICTFTMLKLDVCSREIKFCETFGTTAKISFVLELPTGHLKVIKSKFISIYIYRYIFFFLHELSFHHYLLIIKSKSCEMVMFIKRQSFAT